MRSPIYKANSNRATTVDKTPTMTDQAGARDTDINVIIGRYGIGGQAPGMKGQPQFDDFSEIPTDLREMIEKARELQMLQSNLPAEYRHMSTEELLSTPPAVLKQMQIDAKTITDRRLGLPEHLRRMSDKDILGLTPEQYQSMLPKVETTTQEVKK